MEKPSVWTVFLANFAMGRNTEAEKLNEYDMLQAYACWNNYQKRKLAKK